MKLVILSVFAGKLAKTEAFDSIAPLPRLLREEYRSFTDCECIVVARINFVLAPLPLCIHDTRHCVSSMQRGGVTGTKVIISYGRF